MKNSKKFRIITVMALLLVMVSSILIGCDSKENDSGNSQTESQSQERIITDQAGRQVTIPDKIDKVYYTNPIGQIMVYVLAPEKMVGWTMQLSDNEKKYLMPEYLDLPYLGGLQMNAKINTEELVKAGPDIIFNVSPDPIEDKTISDSDKLQQQLNIPIVVVDGNIENTEEALTFVGGLLGAEKRTQEIVAYCNEIWDEIVNITKDIPEEQRPRVYYAEGPEGLSTEPAGSSHGHLLDIVKAKNVAEVEKAGVTGMSSVSLEQVLAWNPDIILAWCDDRGGAYSLILSNPDWQNINAVKNKQVYEIPNYPFNWFDRPPSISRFMGLKWLTALFYPDLYPVDMIEEVQELYKLFYQVDLTDAEAQELLKNSLP